MNSFQDLQNLFLFSVSAGQVIRNLLVAFIYGQIEGIQNVNFFFDEESLHIASRCSTH